MANFVVIADTTSFVITAVKTSFVKTAITTSFVVTAVPYFDFYVQHRSSKIILSLFLHCFHLYVHNIYTRMVFFVWDRLTKTEPYIFSTKVSFLCPIKIKKNDIVSFFTKYSFLCPTYINKNCIAPFFHYIMIFMSNIDQQK